MKFVDFKGKTAVITGAKQGIGLGIAKKLSGLGANIVISDLNLKECKKVCRKLQGESLAIKCDVSKATEVEKMIKATVKRFGNIDIIVNNAGIYPFKPLVKLTEKSWKKTIEVNLQGTFLCAQKAAKQMIKQEKGGKIINISSIASVIGYPALTHYCASKGGINAMTRSMAIELAEYKINVNAVCPGIIRTPGIEKGMNEKQIKGMTQSVPWKRTGTPEDIANAVAFLASSEADYITGQTLIVDGGWTVKP